MLMDIGDEFEKDICEAVTKYNIMRCDKFETEYTQTIISFRLNEIDISMHKAKALGNIFKQIRGENGVTHHTHVQKHS